MYDSPYPPRWSDRPRSRKPAEPHRQPTTPRSERLQRARSHAQKRRLRRLTVLALWLLLGVELVAVVLTSPVFAVKQVRLYGLAGLPSAESEAVGKVVALPGTTNFLRAPVGDVERQLKALPYVRTATVARRLPNRIEARIQARIPLVVVEIGGKRFEVDAEGVPIRLARLENAKLPRIALKRLRPVEPGVALNDSALRALLTVLQTPGVDLWEKIAKIEVDQNEFLCLNMRDGVKVELGGVDELPKKFALAQKVYASESEVAQRFVAINLSSPDWPACTLRPVAVQEAESLP
jgi:cell division protein FtsQ